MMTQGFFDASNTTIPHISNNMYHGQSPLQFTVRQIMGGCFIYFHK
jgi:hypothetical protein